MPRFSIILTTTRPEWVLFALKSALDQRFLDFEVVLSDNSPEGMSGLFSHINDRRIKYVRPESYLNVSDHWNFAFSHASGLWQTILCDDHVFVPSCLEIVNNALHDNPETESISFSSANYAGDQHTTLPPHTLQVPNYSLNQKTHQCGMIIDEMFDKIPGSGPAKALVPWITNAFYNKNAIDRIRQRHGGKLFFPIDPMTSSALLLLATTKSTVRLNLPLVLYGYPYQAAGNHKAPGNHNAFKAMHQGAEFRYAEIPSMRIFPSTMVETMLATREKVPEHLGRYKINTVKYFQKARAAVAELSRQGWDNSEEQSIYDHAFRQLPRSIQRRIDGKTSFIRRLLSQTKHYLYKLIQLRSPVEHKLPLETDLLIPGRKISTRQHQITNILEAGNLLEAELFGNDTISGKRTDTVNDSE